jgi:hypothetical protein
MSAATTFVSAPGVIAPRWKAHLARFCTIAAALTVASLLVVSGSRAAFTAQTSNGSNAWDSGTVALSDTDAGSALFTASDILPGYTASKTITVSYTGPAGSTANVTFTPAVTGDAELTSTLLVTVTRDGVVVADGVALSALAGHTFTLTSGGAAVYAFDVSLPSATGDTAQGKSAGATFTWDASVTQ